MQSTIIGPMLTISLLVAAFVPLAGGAARVQDAPAPAEIRALLKSGNVEQAVDSYNRYASERKEEDAALLTAIGQAALRQLADGGHGETLTALALERLARSGDDAARRTLALAATGERTLMPQGLPADASLARLGDDRAAARLVQLAGQTGEMPNRVAVIEAVKSARVAGAATALQKLLDDPSPPVRAAAADALGALGVREAIPRLRALLEDRVLLTRVAAAAALKRLGDPSGDKLLEEWLKSELHDLRLMAAAAYAGSKDARWVPAIAPVLTDPNGVNRLRAAELLLTADRVRARDTLMKGLADANPAVRGEAARVLAATPSPDLEAMRRLLRDQSPWVRLHAAGVVASVPVPVKAPPDKK